MFGNTLFPKEIKTNKFKMKEETLEDEFLESSSTSSSIRSELPNTNLDKCIDCNIGSVVVMELLSPIESKNEIPQKPTPFIYEEKATRIKSEQMILEDDLTERVFETGTKYVGEWKNHDMDGTCAYVFPNGAVFEGKFYKGVFDGVCSIHYPHGGSFQGFWFEGILERWKYMFSDGLVYSSDDDWKYLKKPDRRFWTEIRRGLKPGGAEQITNTVPAQPIPEGLYDAGDGFYNPRDLTVRHPNTGEFMRVPSASDIKWILKNCRKGGELNIGFQKDLYKNWFDVEDKNEISISDFSSVKWTPPKRGGHVNRFRKLYTRHLLDAKHGFRYCADIFGEKQEVKREVETMAQEKVSIFKTDKDLDNMCQKWNKSIKGEILISNFEYSEGEDPLLRDDYRLPIDLSSYHLTKSVEFVRSNHSLLLGEPNEQYATKATIRSPKF